VLACVPWDDADRFGVIGFEEALESPDPRLASVHCVQGECSGADALNTVYQFFDGEQIFTKQIVGEGPSAAFRDLMTPWDPDREDKLHAAVCLDEGAGVWVELALKDGAWSYAMKAQP
jgi:hypothetical protein